MHRVTRTCGVCGKPFRTWSSLPERYCTAPCKVAARQRADRTLKAKFRSNIVAAGRAVNPYWQGKTRKRVLVPSGEGSMRKVAHGRNPINIRRKRIWLREQAEAERIRNGTPDPWE